MRGDRVEIVIDAVGEVRTYEIVASRIGAKYHRRRRSESPLLRRMLERRPTPGDPPAHCPIGQPAGPSGCARASGV